MKFVAPSLSIHPLSKSSWPRKMIHPFNPKNYYIKVAPPHSLTTNLALP